jgi:hypothetical protein
LNPPGHQQHADLLAAEDFDDRAGALVVVFRQLIADRLDADGIDEAARFLGRVRKGGPRAVAQLFDRDGDRLYDGPFAHGCVVVAHALLH